MLIVCGHYGVGKTNLAINLALNAADAGREVVLADLDVVNPYFRSSDYRQFLEERGVRVIAPVMAGTTLDSPSLSGQVTTAIEWAQQDVGDATDVAAAVDAAGTANASGSPDAANAPGRLLIIDAGGDDVGATALGRFARAIQAAPYGMLYVVNRSRNLTQDPAEAAGVLREIEAKARLEATAVANNTHLKQDTDEHTVAEGIPFAREVARLAGLPLAFTTVPLAFAHRKSTRIDPNEGAQTYYPVRVYVRTPWE